MRRTRTTLAAVSTLIALGAVVGCGSSGGTTTNDSNSSGNPSVSSSTSQTGTLSVGLQADPATLDPALSSALVDRQVMANIYDTLFALTPDGKIVPDLVKSYEISQDGKTYTFHLQTGVKFQDGTPFNAAAVKFNLERDLAPTSARKSEVSVIQTIDTPDDNTVVLHLKTPYSPLLGVFTDRAGMMVSPTAVKKEGANYPNHPVGTGPYAFQSRVKGDHITLTANKDYWKGAPKIQQVTFKAFSDPNVELTNLESGAIQLADQVPAQQLASLKQNANFVVSNTAGLGYQGFYLNCSQAPFNNQYLREAVDAAIDRQTIVNVVFKGEASPGWGPFSPESPVYNAKQDTPPAANGSEVEKLLKEGGKPNGFTFTFQTANSPVSTETAQIIQSMLQKYNIKMNIQQLEFGTLLSNNTNHAFQASALGWSGRIDPDQNAYQFWHTGGSENGSNFSDPTVDKLLEQARTQANMSQRAQTYSQFMDEMHKQDPYIFLYFQNNTYAYSKNLQGFQAYPDGVFRIANMSI
ncbi:ABC transporter substrate-binding protein [Alicyclobacillus fastidiosus]|uniref:ABC transporter substrate-binding protein n=1 Tax=Alicyclobacillus fastidiosus TaxID=392011 RepID=A0ABY6ZLX6_9BACL|nr:ABC transporter substrate-binding protein [Alicyclobacillus fastidiosus]WAH43206.1 ABC transporter substrate-binding protein [Alicyclobacillus fastidiosus]GMA65239.1 ABC transporter substrate-binding protein [Alicyclobacillus fastidiosus]